MESSRDVDEGITNMNQFKYSRGFTYFPILEFVQLVFASTVQARKRETQMPRVRPDRQIVYKE